MRVEQITSATNPKIKYVANLQQKKFRDKERVFILEGLRNAEMAIESEAVIKMCFCTSDILAQERAKSAVAKLACPIFEVGEHLYSKMSDTKSPQGLMLIVEQNAQDLGVILAKSTCLVLDRLQDPGNLGTIIRTADAMGIGGIVCLKGTADIFAPKVVRSAMGSIFNLPLAIRVSEQEFLSCAREKGFALYATALDKSAKPLWNVEFKGHCALVLGNEANGVSPNLLDNCSEKIYIPMQGQAESLNVATASAMVMYEYRRQENL